MIYTLCRDVAGMLRSRKFPVRIVYGPPYPQPEACSSGLIIIERDTDSDDVAQPARQARENPRCAAIRVVACRATVFGQSSVAGARRNEHEHECETFVDGLHSALIAWADAAISSFQWGGGRYAKPGDLNFAEKFAGVQYIMRFGIGRGVLVQDYEALAAPTMAPKGVGGQVEIAANGDGPARVLTLPTS